MVKNIEGEILIEFQTDDLISETAFDEAIEDESKLEFYLKEEAENIKNAKVADGNIIVSNTDFNEWDQQPIHFKTFNIYPVDETGKIKAKTVTKKDINNNKNLKLVINLFKKMGIHHRYHVVNNYLKFSCFVCGKSNEKCWIYLNNFGVGTFSKTDCTDQKHKKAYENLTKTLQDLKFLSDNLDKTPVSFDPDWVRVSYKNELNEKVTRSLQEYWDDGIESPILKRNILPIKENLEKLLKHYRIEIKYNIIKRRFEVFKNNVKSSQRLDVYIATIRDLGIKHNFNIPKEKLEIDLISLGYNNQYNIISDFLKKEAYITYQKNPEKAKKEFQKLCDSLVLAEPCRKEFYVLKTLLQSTYMICRPENEKKPISPQFLLVLQGKQGIGKTRFTSSLLPEKFRNDYFQSVLSLNTENKDHLLEISSNWITEFGELPSTFKKSDQNALKGYITSEKDRLRVPYGKEAIDIKRRVTNIATTNDYDYLKDYTGNRRYLTLCLEKIKDMSNIDMTLIWGYMYQLYLDQEPYWLNAEETKELEKYNENYINKSEIYLLLEDLFDLKADDNENWYSVKELYKHIPNGILSSPYSTISSYISLGRALKKFNVNVRQNKHKKSTEYNVIIRK